MKAISIKQPWAYLILNQGKNIENRSWPTKIRGRILIHASQSIDEEAVKKYELENVYFPTGCIVGSVEISDCTVSSTVCSPWNTNSGFCWHLKNPEKLTPFKVKGQLRFFEVNNMEVMK
jgi:hypothetical protein